MLPFVIRHATRTTRARLLLLVAAILFPLAGFSLVLYQQFAQTQRAYQRDNAQTIAQQLSGVIERELFARIAALEALATSPALEQADTLAAFDRQARAIVPLRGFSIVLRDATGQQFVNTMQPVGTALKQAVAPALLATDRLVFESGKPAVSDLFMSAHSGKPLVVVTVPVFREGAIAYVLSLGLEPARLETVLAGPAQPGWTISVIDRTGRFIASSRRDPAFIGRLASADLRRAAQGDKGTWIGQTLEGTEVLGAYARSPLSGWRVAVGVPLQAIAEPLRGPATTIVVSGALVSIMALWLAYLVGGSISRPIARLATAADRLGQGGAVPPLETGLLEVDEVAATLATAEAAVRTREAALQASEERFRAAVRAVNGVIWTNDAAGRMTGVQPGWSALTGQTEAEFSGFGWTRAVHPDDAAPTLAAWEEALRARRTFVFEHRVRRVDGVYRRFAIRAVPIIGADGDIREWVGVHTDITDEFESKALLAAQEAALRDLNATLEQRVEETSAERDRIWRISTELMVVVQFSGVIVALNPAWDTTLGWSDTALRGTALVDLVHPDDVLATLGVLSALIEEGASGRGFSNRCRHRDGSYRWLSWTAVPEAGMIHAIARDVTAEQAAEAALRRTEEQLRQSQKMEIVGQLTGGIAHDFNNLLTVVSGQLEMARRRVESGGEGSRLLRHLASAQEGARRAAVLTHRLLAFSRQSPLQPEMVNLNAVVAGMADLIRRTLGERIRVETRLEAQLWPIRADLNQIENAVLNLCVNARDAMPEGGVLRVKTQNRTMGGADPAVGQGELAAGAYAVLSVADTGTGIAPDIRERVFEPFFTTKPVGKGTGLGLSQVFGFLRQSSGTVMLESEPGAGTTVHLLFPRSSNEGGPARAAAAERAAPGGGGGETCLVVEDEEMVREFTVSALEEAGYTVLAAADGPSGLCLLDAHSEVVLLFTDIVLAGALDGRETAEEAKRRRPALKVLFMTGYTRDASIIGGRLDGNIELLTKPFTSAAMLAKVQSLLAADAERTAG